jgi:hypothetical protein
MNEALVEYLRRDDEEALDEAESASQAKPDGKGSHQPLIIYDAGDIDPTKIPRREWLLGRTFCRKFLSGLVGAGGDGKTAARYTQYLAVAAGRDDLTGERVWQRCRVLIVCLEDSLEEVQRRIAAACLHHKVTREEIKGWLFYCCPRGLKLLTADRSGNRDLGPLYEELRDKIRLFAPGLVGIDPFIKSHSSEENDNNAIDEVCIHLSNIADEFNIADDLIHHTRKGAATPGDADRSRGASAAVDAMRIVSTVTRMTESEQDTFGITKEERESLIRLDDAKINLTPRSAEAMWFKLVGVPLNNGADSYPAGDNVQTVERWYPPDIFANGSTAIWNTIIDEIDKGIGTGQRYSNANNATDRAAWRIVVKYIDRTEKQARAIINTWVKTQVLIAEPYDDPIERKQLKGLNANPAKRPGNELRS